MHNLKKGDKVAVLDEGLMALYRVAKEIDPNAKPGCYGWVDEIMDDDTIMVKFPIGDEDPEVHSQVAPYPSNQVVRNNWK